MDEKKLLQVFIENLTSNERQTLIEIIGAGDKPATLLQLAQRLFPLSKKYPIKD